ncbi:hypothetical protein NLJ89_g5796 [Agrocybe chaxingu]|uniref:Uncharacterized protein n=1 Tax=Agrocybe chaxingu TaxID=84603 RepID=A0A9W8K1U4_9AGAR|nr:hypothetical protein NLJ89_g5796 [Agrocybe chaxingu]
MDPPLVQDLVPSESTPCTFGGYNVQPSQSSSSAVAGPSRIRLEDLISEYDGALHSTPTSAYSSLAGSSSSLSTSNHTTVDAVIFQEAPYFGPYAQVDATDDIPEIAFCNAFSQPGLSSLSSVSSWQMKGFDASLYSGPCPDFSSDELEALGANSAPFHFGDALSAGSDECGAIFHTPAAFDRHLTVDHEIPNAKDVKHSALCAWPKCKSQKVMEVGSYHRHVLERHAMHWRCPFVDCPKRERETVDKKTGEKVMSYPRHTNLGTHIRDDHDPGDLLRIKALYGQSWKFAFACFHGQ